MQRTILITAGPTWEPIDPVRFIANRSSGQLGYALATAARKAGARVTLVSGPTALPPPPGVRFVPVVTGREMYRATLRAARKADLIICAAAVADWRPARVAQQKIKKASPVASRQSSANTHTNAHTDIRIIQLTPNPDILATLGRRKRRDQYLVGFALESEHLLENAKKKLIEKHCDCIIANPVESIGATLHQATLVWPSGVVQKFPPLSKPVLARKIIQILLALSS